MPDCPCGASVLMIALLPTWRLWPEVSTLPPLPPSGPPCALMLPLATVWLLGLLMSEYSTTCPPSPACVALASMVAPAAIVTLVAWRISPLPCQSPPTSTVPPPVAPPASIRLPAASVMSSPSSTILPPRLTRLLASSLPLLRITPACRLASALADRMIKPPGASTALRLSTKVAIAAGVVVMPARVCWPSKFKLIASPAASATVPARATITPLLRTSGASSAI